MALLLLLLLSEVEWAERRLREKQREADKSADAKRAKLIAKAKELGLDAVNSAAALAALDATAATEAAAAEAASARSIDPRRRGPTVTS